MPFCKCAHHVHITGFHTGVENMGEGLMGGSHIGRGALQNLMGGGGLSQYMGGGEHGEFKMLLKNTCEGVHLLVKLPAISLQAYKFTKNELLRF